MGCILSDLTARVTTSNIQSGLGSDHSPSSVLLKELLFFRICFFEENQSSAEAPGFVVLATVEIDLPQCFVRLNPVRISVYQELMLFDCIIRARW